jgi:hypothetical protein
LNSCPIPSAFEGMRAMYVSLDSLINQCFASLAQHALQILCWLELS